MPNALSLSRFFIFAAAVLWLATDQRWLAACIVLAVGASTDLLDGYIARRFDAETKLGRDLLEPLCDLTLTVAAVVGLMIAGVWPWSVGWVIIGVTAVFQLISWFAQASDFMRRLKRHQYYLHPLLYVAVLFAAMYTYINLATESMDVTGRIGALVLFYVVTILVIRARREWITELLKGPKAEQAADASE